MTDTSTVTKPRQDAEEDALTGLEPGDADERMKAHRVCPICYPGAPMGSVALCGEKVLGIHLWWHLFLGKNHCKTCTVRRAYRHFRDVHGGRVPPASR